MSGVPAANSQARDLPPITLGVSGLHSDNYTLRYVDGALTLWRVDIPSAPAYSQASPAPRATPVIASEQSSRTESYNAPVALLPQGGGLPHSGELFLRIVSGGIRLPQGITETF